MKVQLKLERDTYNSFCNEKFIEFETGEDYDVVAIKLGDREVCVDRCEFKKMSAMI
jgi:hypothetical protein